MTFRFESNKVLYVFLIETKNRPIDSEFTYSIYTNYVRVKYVNTCFMMERAFII